MAIDEVEDKNWLTVSLSSVQRQANEFLGRDLNDEELELIKGELEGAIEVVFEEMDHIIEDHMEMEEE